MRFTCLLIATSTLSLFWYHLCRDSLLFVFFFLMIRRPPRSTLDRSSAASDVYKRQTVGNPSASSHCATITTTSDCPRPTTAPGSGWWGRCLLYTSQSPRDRTRSRMPSSAWKKKQTSITLTTDIHVHTSTWVSYDTTSISMHWEIDTH